jgi:ABC-type dipeptide/oligopeptide/nickel transport system permease subunit
VAQHPMMPLMEMPLLLPALFLVRMTEFTASYIHMIMIMGGVGWPRTSRWGGHGFS